MSAPQRASEPAAAEFASADRASAPTPIRLPRSDRTYEVRDVLRGMGLRWDPATHAWRGRLPHARRVLLEQRFGLVPQVVVPIEAFQTPATDPVTPPTPALIPRGPPRDYSRSRLEACLAFPGGEEEAEPAERRFSLQDTTSGLPDDSREADERAAARHLRDFRARVKAARALVSGRPGFAETLARDWKRAAAFYARIGITEAQFRHGVPLDNGELGEPPAGCSTDALPREAWAGDGIG